MIENLENEQWKAVSGYEDLYQVSNYGSVKSLKGKEERILKPSTSKNGYQQVIFCKDGKQKKFTVHRLVANAFIPNYNNLPQVNHINENKCNNHVSNLEWCDCKYNINYGSWIEKHSGENHPKPMLGKFGKEHHRSKQIVQLTLDNEVIKIWDSIADVERELGYNNRNICSCCRGKRKTSNGYKWCYA